MHAYFMAGRTKLTNHAAGAALKQANALYCKPLAVYAIEKIFFACMLYVSCNLCEANICWKNNCILGAIQVSFRQLLSDCR